MDDGLLSYLEEFKRQAERKAKRREHHVEDL